MALVRKTGTDYFSRAYSDRPRYNGFKLKENKIRLGERKEFFLIKEVKH